MYYISILKKSTTYLFKKYVLEAGYNKAVLIPAKFFDIGNDISNHTTLGSQPTSSLLNVFLTKHEGKQVTYAKLSF